MADSDLKEAVKNRVGHSLADEAGDLCMRTKCQDIVPRLLSGLCKEPAHGKRARAYCKPFLQQCQNDHHGRADCSDKCARYFEADRLSRCIRDCNIARCRVYQPYDACVAQQTMLHVLQCMDSGDGRRMAEQCLKHRCGLNSRPAPLAPE